jgi:Zn-dependent protease/predicted transcriptional regulator
MKWSWRIGTVRGIGIFVHWTFLILIGWIVLSHLRQGADVPTVISGVGLVLAVFGCVVLHELGHALTAQRYHIRTRDITLLPIGGVARLERMPDHPTQELLVALAGPAVNVAIAALLYALLLVTSRTEAAGEVHVVGGDFLGKLMWINVTLVAFNLLPAFPMDGGRVLRALLAQRLEYARATRIAAGVGQGMAVLFGLAGLLYLNNPFLVFIALFVWLGAQEEARAAQLRSAFRGVPVRDAMMTRFRTLDETDPLMVAKDELLAGAQQDFPVMVGGRVAGILGRNDLVKGLADRGVTGRVGEVMRRECPVAEEHEPLDAAYQRMRQAACSAMPVLRGGELVGILTLENVSELLMVRSVLQEG